MKKNCVICDAEFEAKTCGKICSDECRHVQYRKKNPLLGEREKECLECNTSFKYKYSNKIFCSTKCKERNRPKKPPNPPKKSNCDYCGKEYLYTKFQKYCCTRCRMDASNKRKRDAPKKGFTPVVRQCKDCETQITVTHLNTKLCDPCREKKRLYRQREYKNAWRESKKAPIEDKTCLHCSKVFTPKVRNNAMYCNYTCTKEAHKEKSRQETKERQAKIPLRECKACKEMFKPSKDDPKNILCGYKCYTTWTKMRSKMATEERQRNNTPRVCVGCEETFMPNRYDVGSKQMQIYCEKKCHDRHKRELRLQATKEKAKLIKPRICLTCNKSFMPLKHDTGTRKKKYCNASCAKNDPERIIPNRMRSQLRKLFTVKTNKTFTLFPYNSYEITEHIKSLFDSPKWYGDKWVNDTGYSMDNIKQWSIDHIRPVASFSQKDLSNPNSEDFKKCWALENLQPLWNEVNHSKSDKWDGIINA